MITEQQYQRLMNEYAKSGVLCTAAMKAGMHRETAAKYLWAGHGPQPEKRRGRRRPDPLTTIWPQAERVLADAPEVEAKALFEHLLARTGAPQALPAQKALRTFQRRVLGWRRRHGPPKEVFFPQAREPAASMQLDWTHAAELGVIVAGQKWEALLCHAVLPYSNWQWAVPCRSESMLSDAPRSAGRVVVAGRGAVEVADRPQFDGHPCVAPHDGQTGLQHRVSGSAGQQSAGTSGSNPARSIRPARMRTATSSRPTGT